MLSQNVRTGALNYESVVAVSAGVSVPLVTLALEGGGGSPWRRARFLALRHDLASEWQPANGVERQLIDQMALAYSATLDWLDTLATRGGHQSRDERREARETGRWQPPRVSEQEAIDQAAAMVDRFNKIFLRTLRATACRSPPRAIRTTRSRRRSACSRSANSSSVSMVEMSRSGSTSPSGCTTEESS